MSRCLKGMHSKKAHTRKQRPSNVLHLSSILNQRESDNKAELNCWETISAASTQ